MTGWRLGWITGPSEVMEGVKTCQASSASHVPTFLMGAAAVALDCEEERESFFESFAERRDVFHALLQDIPGIVAPKPEGAFYILADIPVQEWTISNLQPVLLMRQTCNSFRLINAGR